MSDQFHELLESLIRTYMDTSGLTLEEVAKRCNYSASGLRFLRHGERKPRDRGVVKAIASALELDATTTNRLLEAAGFALLSQSELIAFQESSLLHEGLHSEAARILEPPDQDALSEVIAYEPNRFLTAWDGYLRARTALYERRWEEVSKMVDQGLTQWYLPLRQQSARYFGYLSLLKVAADEYRGALHEALYSAKQAVHAAEISEDAMLRCRCHTRLADIYKFSGRFKEAAIHYDRADEVLHAWKPPSPAQETWAKHWGARILRKRASHLLFQGKTDQAERDLLQSVQMLQDLGSRYELSRAYYNLGWAYSDQGKWDEAIDVHEKGLSLTNDLRDVRTWRDSRQEFEGHLGLASDHLHKGEYVVAKQHLDDAERLTLPEENPPGERAIVENLKSFHEVGRLWLLQGKLYLQDETIRNFQTSKNYLDEALKFHEKEEVRDPARMASIHNALGLLYLERGEGGDRINALNQFERALIYVEGSDPPLLYYHAASLVNMCQAYIRVHMIGEITVGEVEKIVKDIDAVMAKAEQLCARGKYWAEYTRLELTRAEHSGWLEEWGQLADHGALAMIYARNFNRITLDRSCHHLAKVIMSVPARCRKEVLDKIVDGLRARGSLQEGRDLDVQVAVARLREVVME